MNPEADSFERLRRGLCIPACPLALTSSRRLDERRQRALVRYYLAAGVGGLAVGVHTTQFEIRDPRHGLFQPVLELAAEELKRCPDALRIGGICGATPQARREAATLRLLGYHAGLLSLGALKSASIETLLAHCRTVAEVLPIVGFYLQPLVGGRLLPKAFWDGFVQIPNVVAIKIAPFNRYQTLDVVRAVIDSGRTDIALYTGNDDSIIHDLISPFSFGAQTRRIVGGLLGHWSVWTRPAVDYLGRCQTTTVADQDLLRLAVEVTDANAAFFDAANGYAGCIAGLHEVLRRQGLMEGTWCLNENETLSTGQAAEIDRVHAAYPHLRDDDFVSQHLDSWLA